MVVDYLQTCDFLVFISEASLKKLIRDEDCKILNAQTMAYGYISEKLSGRYQIIKELSKEGGQPECFDGPVDDRPHGLFSLSVRPG